MLAISDETDKRWTKSSRSTIGNCVEVARTPVAINVRDSKDPQGPALRFPAGSWTDFIGAIRDGQV